MIRIKCVNKDCPSPDGKFDLDETIYVDEGGGLAKAREPDAKLIVVPCEYCGAQNGVWLKGVKKKDQLRRGRRR